MTVTNKGATVPSKQAITIKQEDDFFTILKNQFNLIGKTWDALLLNLGTFIWVYIAPAFVLAIGAAILVPMFITSKDSDHLTALTVIAAAIAAFGLIIVAILMAIASTITQLASVHGKKVTFQEVLSQSQTFFWRFIGLGIVSLCLMIIGALLFILPLFAVIFFLTFTIYVMVDKNTGVKDAIKGSYELTKKNWKIVLAFLVLEGIIQIPSIVPVLGTFVTLCLSIAYFCLPAFLYTFMTSRKAKA
jgi:hypothetical protein